MFGASTASTASTAHVATDTPDASTASTAHVAPDTPDASTVPTAPDASTAHVVIDAPDASTAPDAHDALVHEFIEDMLYISKFECSRCELRFLSEEEMHEKCGEGSMYTAETGKVFCAFPNRVMFVAQKRFCARMRQCRSKPCYNCVTEYTHWQNRARVDKFIEDMLSISRRECLTCELCYLSMYEMYEKCEEGSLFTTQIGKVFCAFPNKVMIVAQHRFCAKMLQCSSMSCDNCVIMYKIYTRGQNEAPQ